MGDVGFVLFGDARVTVVLDEGVVTLDGPCPAHATEARFVAGDLDDAILEAAGLVGLVKARARLAWRRRGARRPPPAPPARPRVSHLFGGGRGGSGGVIWLLGRRVAASAAGVPHYEATFAEHLAGGFPPATRAAIGEARCAAADETIWVLHVLPCFCGTGCLQPDQHDAFFTLARSEDPRAPIDVHATAGQCTVCDRVAIYEAMGDPMHSYDFTVTDWDPGAPDT